MAAGRELIMVQIARTFTETEEPLDVISEISPVDPTFEGSEAHYFESGRSALECIRLAMLLARKQTVENALDLPCGWGRQTRTIKAAFPSARLTACDIDREGVDFCARVFGATPIYAEVHPKDIRIDDCFDLIWCGSLLTHLDAGRNVDLLRLFASLLEPGGVAVFTTHGRFSAGKLRDHELNYGLPEERIDDLVRQYDTSGFGYVDYWQQVDYGISLASPSWICAELEKLPSLRLVGYTERGWHDHHDVVACVSVESWD
jgi:SAM-dependent methyltransferase